MHSPFSPCKRPFLRRIPQTTRRQWSGVRCSLLQASTSTPMAAVGEEATRLDQGWCRRLRAMLILTGRISTTECGGKGSCRSRQMVRGTQKAVRCESTREREREREREWGNGGQKDIAAFYFLIYADVVRSNMQTPLRLFAFSISFSISFSLMHLHIHSFPHSIRSFTYCFGGFFH